MATLYSQTTSCLRLFDSLVDHLENGSEENRKNFPAVQVQNQAARLKVWSSNLGALKAGHAALDYRLRDSTAIRNAIQRSLDQLEETLMNSCVLAKGDRAPMSETSNEYATTYQQEESTDSDDSSVLHVDNELSFNLAEIVDILSDLHKLSFRIRNPGTRSTAESTLKARLYREIDPYTGEDVFEQYSMKDILRISGLVVDFHLQNGKELDSAINYLIERAGTANTNRRRCFAYWKSHSSKLADMPRDAHLTISAVHPRAASAPDPDITHPQLLASNMSQTHSSFEQRTITSGTEATKFTQKIDLEWDSQSHGSLLSTTYDTDGEYTHPPAPSIAAGAKEHTCPYYRITWKEHERLAHRRVWYCFEHPNVIGPKSSTESHLVEHHKELNASQIQSFLGMAVSDRPDDRSRCPFCGSEGPFVTDLTDHLAWHMERFAMIASPLNSDKDDYHLNSDGRAVISGGSASRPSLSSLSSFRSLDPEARNEADYEHVTYNKSPIEYFEDNLDLFTRFSVLDRKPFVLDSPLLTWFRTRSIFSPKTNADVLLSTITDIDESIMRELEAHMADGDTLLWLRVFAILLQIKKGPYIERFWKLRFLDSQLPFSLAQLQEIWNINDERIEEAEWLTDSFMQLQHQHCANNFGQYFEASYDDEAILPFTEMRLISNSTFEVHIPLECIDQRLETRVRTRPIEGPGGKYHQLALVIWDISPSDKYELRAYKAHASTAGVVKCHGIWERKNQNHVLLEWSSDTLENYLHTSNKTISKLDVEEFWRHILAVVQGLHNFQVAERFQHGEGPWNLWHCNISPSTIFYVDDGDSGRLWRIGGVGPAEVRFRKDYSTPLTRLRKGTIQYGGPELRHFSLRKLTQRFDVWSLGCVLSEVAMWVVLGSEGVEQFRSLRQMIPTPGCFHNGSNVSEVVLEWHRNLRRSIDEHDTITGQVLGIIESRMLLGDPMDRSSPKELIGIFKSCLDSALELPDLSRL
ncbi:hypothetical protein PG984_000258 [Apiospora sp. TS-2023a]